MASYLVTGASRGIGLEFVTQLSANPKNTVFALVRNKATSSKLSDVAARAPNLHILQADIVDVEALKAAAADVAKVTGGSLDHLINNAALLDQGRTVYTLTSYANGQEDLLEKDIQGMIQTNVIGVIHTINIFLPLLRKSSIKKVITISSGVADSDFTVATGFSASAPYAISKAAVNLAVAKYAAELKDEGFTFLAVSPGLVNTAQSPPSPEVLEAFVKLISDFKKAYPDWDGIPLTPETSVKHVLSVIEKATPKDSGAFVSHFGNKQWL